MDGGRSFDFILAARESWLRSELSLIQVQRDRSASLPHAEATA